jgi:hypothetical protein
MIYVDDHFAQFGRMKMCHLLSDESLDELHAFAAQLGMKRSWFQNGSAPHYDVSKGKREEAIQLGAVPIGVGTEKWTEVVHAARAFKRRA